MFRKLLKHDLKSVGRVCLPLTIGALLLSILGLVFSGVHVFLNEHTADLANLSYEAYEAGNDDLSALFDILWSLAHLTNFASVLAMFFIIIAFSALSIAITVLIVVNFYKTLITDQGYLTFTLPVSPTKIFLSKILNGTFWSLLFAVVTTVGIGVMLAPPLIFDSNGFIKYFIDILFAGIHPLNLVLMIFLYVEVWFAGVVVSLIYYFFAVFLGGVITPKGKFVTGAAFIVVGHIAYYAFQQILSFVVMISTVLIFALAVELGIVGSMDALDTIAISNISMLISFISLVIIGTVFFFLTKWLMNKKLNLP